VTGGQIRAAELSKKGGKTYGCRTTEKIRHRRESSLNTRRREESSRERGGRKQTIKSSESYTPSEAEIGDKLYTNLGGNFSRTRNREGRQQGRRPWRC